jgi:dynein heavy chain
VIGPKLNKTYLFFIDDLNMPTVEREGAQPAIELLRQVIDHQNWYDFSDKKEVPLI